MTCPCGLLRINLNSILNDFGVVSTIFHESLRYHDKVFVMIPFFYERNL